MIVIRGRKRKPGQREPNGRPQREKGVDPKAIAALMPHRRLVPADVMHDPKAESILGRLCLNGWICANCYDAGIKYREIVLRYRAVIDSPRYEHSLSGVAIGPWAGSGELDDDEAHRRKATYDAAFEHLESIGGIQAARAVANCAVRENRDFALQPLKVGCSVLCEHFGLTCCKDCARRQK